MEPTVLVKMKSLSKARAKDEVLSGTHSKNYQARLWAVTSILHVATVTEQTVTQLVAWLIAGFTVYFS
jgi:hypothetical protein